jgi:hypothetical protein
VRGFFDRRRARRSRTVFRRTSDVSIETALGVLIVVVLVIILLRVLGLI